MDCRVCGGRSEVTHTERRSESVLRDRRCKKCGNTWRTLESFHVEQKSLRKIQPAKPARSDDKPAPKVEWRGRMREHDLLDDYGVIDDIEEVRDVLRDIGVENGWDT